MVLSLSFSLSSFSPQGHLAHKKVPARTTRQSSLSVTCSPPATPSSALVGMGPQTISDPFRPFWTRVDHCGPMLNRAT